MNCLLDIAYPRRNSFFVNYHVLLCLNNNQTLSVSRRIVGIEREPVSKFESVKLTIRVYIWACELSSLRDVDKRAKFVKEINARYLFC
jgi:hypothetical protein